MTLTIVSARMGLAVSFQLDVHAAPQLLGGPAAHCAWSSCTESS
jgi:hypothetical protein